MDILCRLCARQSNVLESVFSFQHNRLVTDLIAIICPVKIDVRDEYPKKICEECLEIVISASKLRDTSVKCDINFRSGNFVYPLELPELSISIKQEKIAVAEVVEEDPFTNLESYDQAYSDEDWFQDEQPSSEHSLKRRENQVSYEKKTILVNNDYRWQCPSGCGRSFSHQTNIMRHVRRFHDPDLLPVGCNFCSFRFKTFQKLRLHVIRAHECEEKTENEKKKEVAAKKPVEFEEKKYDPFNESSQTPFENSEGLFECDLCCRIYNKKVNILNHMKMCHSAKQPRLSYAGAFKCDLCEQEFSFVGNMYRHKSRFHSDDSPFPCSLCTNRFRTLRLLKLHHHKFHGSEDFLEVQGHNLEEKGLALTAVCQYCGQDFKGVKRQLETHLLREHSDQFEPLQCHMCSKLMVFSETLKTHIQTHKKKIKTQGFPHACKKCGQRFLKEESLARHMESHNYEPGLTCHICGKSLSSALALEHHIRRHEDQKEFPCSQCPSQFVSQTELDRHRITHTSNRPFACELCPMTFKVHEILKKHMKRVHYKTMERNFPCDFCLKKFYTPYSLERHVRIHTGEKPFKCQYCESSFTQKGDCIKHMQRVHIVDSIYSCSMDECTATFRLKSELTDHYKFHYQV